MTISCVADAVATSSAAMATGMGETAGLQSARSTIAAISNSCVSISQPRRRPSSSERIGTSSASVSGAHRNFTR